MNEGVTVIMSCGRFGFAAVLLPSCFCCLLACPLSAQADKPFDHEAWHFLSNTGNVLYLAAGIGLPLIEDGRAGRNHALRSLDGFLVSELLTDGLKPLIREKRPDNNVHDSFPSGHAATAFAVAGIESGLHPKQAPYWYAGAALISASRVGLHRHTVGDVLAGALIGYGVARLELSSRRGLLLAPLIVPEKRAYGFSASVSW